MSEDQVVYMDTNATTPLADEVLEIIYSSLRDAWANPSSAHPGGRQAKRLISWSRQKVADMLNCEAGEVIFTSGATEANNWVVNSAVTHWRQERTGDGRPHAIITNLEHDSVKKTALALESQGVLDVTVVAARHSTARVHVEDVEAVLTPNTVLVSVMLANNETGVLQPVGEIAQLLREWSSRTCHRRPWLHTDAAQAVGKVRVDVEELGVDYLTIVGHKFYGPRNGALYIRQNGRKAPLHPFLFGGGQEGGLRPGTENTGYIAGLGCAAELVTQNLEEYHKHMMQMSEYLRQKLREAFQGDVHFNAFSEDVPRLPNTCNVSIMRPGSYGYAILANSSRFAASTGAACHSNCAEPSQILVASGVDPKVAARAIRLSTGRKTTLSDIDLVVAEIVRVVDILERAEAQE